MHYQEHPDLATGTCAYLLNHRGERALIANTAASTYFSTDHLRTKKSMELVSAAKFLYFPGFFLTDCLPSLLRVAQISADEGKTLMLNLSAPFIVHFFQDELMRVIPYCDIIFANETETIAFGEVKGWGKEVSQIALRIAGLPKASGSRPRFVVVTQGYDATLVASSGSVSTYPVE